MAGKQEVPILMVGSDAGTAERRYLCHSTQGMREGIRAHGRVRHPSARAVVTGGFAASSEQLEADYHVGDSHECHT